MKQRLSFLAVLACLILPLRAAVPPPEQLLPADTLAVVTVPDWKKAAAAFKQSPQLQLWDDPAMQPFREKFMTKFKEEVVAPLERELRIKFADYAGLAQGQVTLAFTQSGWTGKDGKWPGFVLLLDSGEHKGKLKDNLADLKKKWLDAGKQLKADKIRDVEFTTILLDPADLEKTLDKAFPSKDAKGETQPEAKPDEAARKIELSLGQSDSLLLAGNDPKLLEKVLIRLSGGGVPALAEEAAFQANHRAQFREALSYAWVNWKPILEALLHADEDDSGPSPRASQAVPMAKALPALGLDRLRTVAFGMNNSSDGTQMEFFLGVPESGRQGLFRMLVADAKDASAPPFVPADAVKFLRWRLDGQRTWAELENIMTQISPQWGGALKLVFETAGKDKDEKFDLRKSLIGNLGNDMISFERPPRSNSPADLNSPPALFLLGTLDGEQLVQGLKMVASLLPPPLSAVAEREFLGRKIYSFALPPLPGAEGGKPVEHSFSFASSGGYLAMTKDTASVEDFLRNGERTDKALRDVVGLTDAAQKVGGMATGLFGFENNAESMRVTWEAVKKDPAVFDKMLSLPPMLGRPNVQEGQKGFKEWLDFSLLPTWDKVAKYFSFTVWSGNAAAEGLSFKVYSPMPPQLKK